jgi:hypothetical protein
VTLSTYPDLSPYEEAAGCIPVSRTLQSIHLRQKMQAKTGERLNDLSESCIRDAIKEMGISDGVFGGAATSDRSGGIEEYRKAIVCSATFTAINRMGISPALLFNIDEVGICLDERTKKVRILRYPKSKRSSKVRKKCVDHCSGSLYRHNRLACCQNAELGHRFKFLGFIGCDG